MKARGSWRAKAREKAEREALAPKPAKAKKKWKPLSRGELLVLIRLVPGYDPFRDAEGYQFDAVRANKALAFFPEKLTHIEGALAGKPFILERWQMAIVANLFGWVAWSKKWRRWVRRYREALIYVARKSGKSPLCAGIGLFELLEGEEQGQQDYLAANSREQAGKLFRYAKGMVKNNPDMAAACRVYGGTAQAGQSKSIVKQPDEASFLQVISADGETAHGGTSHLVLIDELHTQPNRELVDTLATSMASENRAEPLTLHVTTADYRRESICNEKHAYACQVRDGVVRDARFLPVIYEAKVSDDWTDEAVWAKANPNLGVSVSLDYLRSECEKAKQNPRLENVFKRLHLNIQTETDIRWLPADLWARGDRPIDLDSLQGVPCHAGLDFGWRDDYAALVLVFKVEETYLTLCWFWLPRNGRRDRKAEPTASFVADGLVTLTDGEATDVEAIYATLGECRERYDLRTISLDPNNARKQGQDLMADGFSVFEFFQSKKHYNEPCRFLESLLKDGRLVHGGHRVLSWMAGNVSLELNGLGEVMPKKVKSAEKIDGICALTMALKGWLAAPETSNPMIHLL